MREQVCRCKNHWPTTLFILYVYVSRRADDVAVARQHVVGDGGAREG